MWQEVAIRLGGIALFLLLIGVGIAVLVWGLVRQSGSKTGAQIDSATAKEALDASTRFARAEQRERDLSRLARLARLRERAHVRDTAEAVPADAARGGGDAGADGGGE